MSIPPWVAYVFVALVVAFGAWRLWAWHRAAEQWQDEFLPLPIPTAIPARVRGSVDLKHFAACWDRAFECVAAFGPWQRTYLLEKLDAGGVHRVHVMPSHVWKNGAGALVGGELVAGVMRVGPNLDVLCHELCHRCEDVLEKAADNSHVTWQGRGLYAADSSYRGWLSHQKV